MKSNILKTALFLALSTALFSSCASDDYGVPSIDCVDPNITATKTVADIKSIATATATQYTSDDIIEAVVVSSDKGGNFYKKIYLTSLDGEIGFSLAINQTDLYLDYQPGRKVFIKLKDLYVQMSHSTLAIGALFNGNVGQIPLTTYRNHIERSCKTLPEVDLVNEMSLQDALNDANLGKLIKLKDVQFAAAAIGQNYYNPANVLGGETNHIITNNAAETTKLIFRTGSFAEYGSLPVSDKRGTITGILTKFNNDYQFVSRFTTDINLTEQRDGEVNPNPDPVDPTDPTDPTAPSEPGANAVALFAGNTFEDFPAFVASLNSFGLQAYATQGAAGTGFNGGRSLHINTTGLTLTGNPYVFTTLYTATIPANATKISFYVKGTSAGKSLSLNLYNQAGQHQPFNVGDLTVNKLITPSDRDVVNNQYAGTIDTNNQWVLVTLDISSLTNLSNNASQNYFALKIGGGTLYDLHLDNFVIE